MSNPSLQKSAKDGVIKASLASGAAGAVAGAAGTAGVQAAFAGQPADAPAPKADDAQNQAQQAQTEQTNSAPIATNHDEMTFGQAFAAARDEVGAGGIFKWHGRYYGTYTKDEWQGMSGEEKQAYAQSLPDQVYEAEDSWQHGHATARVVHAQHQPAAQQTAHHEGEARVAANEEKIDDIGGGKHEVSETPALQVHEVGVETLDDGQQIIVASATVQGHDAVIIDTDMDGIADVLVVDENDNGRFDEGEGGNISGQGVSMTTLQQMAEQQQYVANNDLPDYTNDADVSGMA